MVTLLQELHPNLLIHLFAKNDLYLSINMAQLLTFNPLMCSNFSVALFCQIMVYGITGTGLLAVLCVGIST
jgi:hypothetical protein